MITGKVVDVETKKSISFVSITYLNDTTQYGVYSDSLGNYIFRDRGSSVKMSCIGYETKVINISVLLSNPIIELSPITYSLNAVEIKPKAYKTIQLGHFKNKVYRKLIEDPKHVLMYRKYFNYIAQFIPNTLKKNDLLITKLRYNLSNHFKKADPVNEKGCEATLLRIHLFENDEAGKPGKEMLTKNVVFKNDCKTDNLIIDITDEYLYMPINGIFVAIEFIDNSNASTSNYPFYLVESSNELKSLNTYFSNHQQNWQKKLYEIKSQGKVISYGFNVQFGIEVSN